MTSCQTLKLNKADIETCLHAFPELRVRARSETTKAARQHVVKNKATQHAYAEKKQSKNELKKASKALAAEKTAAVAAGSSGRTTTLFSLNGTETGRTTTADGAQISSVSSSSDMPDDWHDSSVLADEDDYTDSDDDGSTTVGEAFKCSLFAL